MVLLVFICWIIVGIVTIARLITAYRPTKPEGPIMKFLDSLESKVTDVSFFAILVGMLFVSIILWPLVIIYQFIGTRQSNQEQATNQISPQPRE